MPKIFIDIEEAAKKGRAALTEMERSSTPGQTQFGGKADLLRTMKPEIMAMFEKKYTARQIADALKSAGIEVQPKSITESVRDLVASPKKRPRPRKTARPAPSLKMPVSPGTPDEVPK